MKGQQQVAGYPEEPGLSIAPDADPHQQLDELERQVSDRQRRLADASDPSHRAEPPSSSDDDDATRW
jgi:hypothetical protein